MEPVNAVESMASVRRPKTVSVAACILGGVGFCLIVAPFYLIWWGYHREVEDTPAWFGGALMAFVGAIPALMGYGLLRSSGGLWRGEERSRIYYMVLLVPLSLMTLILGRGLVALIFGEDVEIMALVVPAIIAGLLGALMILAELPAAKRFIVECEQVRARALRAHGSEGLSGRQAMTATHAHGTAAAAGLGPFVQVYTRDDEYKGCGLAALLPLLYVSVVVTEITCAARGFSSASLAAGAISAGLIAILVWERLTTRSRYSRGIYLFQGGLVLASDGSADPVPWSDITSVEQQALGDAASPLHRYVITRRGGATLPLDQNTISHTELANAIMLHTKNESKSTPAGQGFPPKRMLTPEWAPRIASMALNQGLAGYSEEGIRQADQIVDNFRYTRMPVKKMEDAFYVYGCYLGEVMVCCASGQWVATDEAYRAEMAIPFVVRFPDGRWADPITHVIQRFQNQKEATLMAFYLSCITPRQS